MSDVTRVLAAIENGEAGASDRLLPLVYSELRKLAASRMRRESPGQTLDATSLVHEAYLRLVGPEADADPAGRNWNSKAHFFGAAAEAMRRILVDRARHKDSLKAGGNRKREELSVVEPAGKDTSIDLIELDDVLARLAAIAPRKAELVKLRYFAGLTMEQAAATLGISVSTAANDWAHARSWLKVALEGEGPDAGQNVHA